VGLTQCIRVYARDFGHVIEADGILDIANCSFELDKFNLYQDPSDRTTIVVYRAKSLKVVDCSFNHFEDGIVVFYGPQYSGMSITVTDNVFKRDKGLRESPIAVKGQHHQEGDLAQCIISGNTNHPDGLKPFQRPNTITPMLVQLRAAAAAGMPFIPPCCGPFITPPGQYQRCGFTRN